MEVGPGFKGRVAADLEARFEKRADLKDKLEEITTTLWDELVLAPMRRLVAENAPEIGAAGNVIPFRQKPLETGGGFGPLIVIAATSLARPVRRLREPQQTRAP